MIVGICDALTRIRNAVARRKVSVKLNRTKALLSLLEFLRLKGAVAGYRSFERIVKVWLYYRDGASKIEVLKPYSKPSFKRYMACKEIDRLSFMGGYYVVSTSSGWLSSFECIERGTGGLVVFFIRLLYNEGGTRV